jgi:nucleotidyltransferase/DNA polymerase involved in DNA repair
MKLNFQPATPMRRVPDLTLEMDPTPAMLLTISTKLTTLPSRLEKLVLVSTRRITALKPLTSAVEVLSKVTIEAYIEITIDARIKMLTVAKMTTKSHIAVFNGH